MVLIQLENVQKRFRDQPLLRDASLLVEDGARIGLVGKNGSGKSTLLKILAGSEEMDDGRRTIKRGLRMAMLEQEPHLDPEKTIREEVHEGLGERGQVLDQLEQLHLRMADPDVTPEELESLLRDQVRLDDRLEALGGHEVSHRIEATIRAVGLPDPDAKCAGLSGGEARRAALAKVLLSEPELLLLDEPTNHLDAEVIAWLEDFLIQQFRGGLVLVSHDRYVLDRVVSRIVEVDRGRLFSTEGGYADYVQQRTDRLMHEQRSEQSRLNALRRETAWIKRGPPARTTKSKSRIKAYEKLKGDAPDVTPEDLTLKIPSGGRLGDRVVTLAGVTVRYGDRTILDHVDLEITRGQRVGIIGPNGAGKSTLIKCCLGLLEPDEGTVTTGPSVEYAVVDQSKADLRADKTVVEEVGGGNNFVDFAGHKMRVESYLEGFLFPSQLMRTKVGDLSGGERSRVALAKMLTKGGNVLVLDEPTNDLDLATLRVLEEALIAFPGVVICISHDRWFLDRVATRVVHMPGGGRPHRVWEGPLSFLLDRLEQEKSQGLERESERKRLQTGDKKAQKGASDEGASKSQLSWDEKQELKSLPDRISAAEEALAEVEQKLNDPSHYEGSQGRAADLGRAHQEKTEAVERLMARWEELEEKASG
ncbi:MAG: ATP-binding cassette domain-containing protein [Planctomycetota bacterium]